MPPSPILAQIGPISIRWYSIMIMLGVVAATWIALREARRRNYNPDHIWGMLPWVLVLGIIGARLGWVVVSLKTIQAEGWQHIFSTWEGGISIQGALVGGIAAAFIYTRRNRLNFLSWTDVVIPGVALAQAIGRWGNFFNQELFGAPCDQPWCITISDPVLRNDPRFASYAGTGTRFAPTFAYEMIWDLLNFGLLMWLGRQKRWQLRNGDLLWVYLIFYSVGRFFLEDVRLDSAIVLGVKAPQFIAGLTIVLALAILLWRHRRGAPAEGEPADAVAPGASAESASSETGEAAATPLDTSAATPAESSGVPLNT